MSRLFLHAARTFVRNLHRYRVVLFALTLVVAVLVFVLGSVAGMRDTLREKAARYFAGDVVALGFEGGGRSRLDEREAVEEAVREVTGAGAGADIPVRAVSRRSTYYETRDISLFFSGYWTQQRRLVGVEWERERPALSRFDFAAGGVPEDGDGEAVLISTAAAESLQVGVGDELLVAIESGRGRANTAELTVRGIYRESSFFGYTTYMERRALNRLKEVPEERVNEIGLYLDRPTRDEARAAEALSAALAERLPSFGVVTDREGYEQTAAARREERHYGVVTVGAQLSEITELLEAVTIIAAVVVLLFLGIVVVGVGNTFTMIVHERSREIGTLRAVGIPRGRLVALFLLESLFLGVGGVILGVALGYAALAALHAWVPFPPTAWSTLFFVGGRLPYRLTPGLIAAVAGLALFAGTAGALRAARRAGRVAPVDALRHE